MAKQSLRMRLVERGRRRAEFEAYADPDDKKQMRALLLHAVRDVGVEEEDPRDALPRFVMEWQGQSGPWHEFRAT